MSGGVVFEDFNRDGWLDLMVSSWGLRDSLRYFENQEGTFEEKTVAAGLGPVRSGLNLVHADYNNDGFPDVLVLRGAWLGEGHPNSLLRNNGDGTFSDVTRDAGLLSFHPTQTASWADFDGDGWVDLFIGNESSREGGPHPSELYRNNGDGTFTEVAANQGIDVRAYVKAATWGDMDNDGDPDLYLSIWDQPNLLYRNDGAAGFTEISEMAGVGEPEISFPAWWWDYNNDGWEDLFVAGWKATAGDVAAEYLGRPHDAVLPRLYKNNQDGTFQDVTRDAALDKIIYAMGSNYGDLDNDGLLDFYAGTGDPDYRALIPNRMFRNTESHVFEEVTGAGGFGHLQKGHGVAFADYDHDGDQDVYAVMGGAYEGDVFWNALFENPGNHNAWLKLRLEGRDANRSAIGARVRVQFETPAGLRDVFHTVSSGGSFGATTFRVELGLGEATSIVSVIIHWPAPGGVQTIQGLQLNRHYTIIEGEQAIETQ